MPVAGRDQSTATTSQLGMNDGSDPAATPGAEWSSAGGPPEQAGWFRFSFVHDRWEWSVPVARLHGYQPHEVIPDARLVLTHQHPDDRRRVAATFDEIRRTSRALSSPHRIIDAHGRPHHVIVIGEPVHSQTGAVTGVQGFYVEIPTPRDAEREQSVTDAVAQIAEARAGIEQAKGMLMAIYGIDADAAFELLKWRSQMTNTKLRLLSQRIAEDFRAMHTETSRSARPEYDEVLLTAHLRVASGS
jgi:hypothetical protein